MGLILTIVATVILTLKIIGVEPVGSWSWWWIMSPIVALVGFLLFTSAMDIVAFFADRWARWRTKRAAEKFQAIVDNMEEPNV